MLTYSSSNLVSGSKFDIKGIPCAAAYGTHPNLALYEGLKKGNRTPKSKKGSAVWHLKVELSSQKKHTKIPLAVLKVATKNKNHMETHTHTNLKKQVEHPEIQLMASILLQLRILSVPRSNIKDSIQLANLQPWQALGCWGLWGGKKQGSYCWSYMEFIYEDVWEFKSRNKKWSGSWNWNWQRQQLIPDTFSFFFRERTADGLYFWKPISQNHQVTSSESRKIRSVTYSPMIILNHLPFFTNKFIEQSHKKMHLKIFPSYTVFALKWLRVLCFFLQKLHDDGLAKTAAPSLWWLRNIP